MATFVAVDKDGGEYVYDVKPIRNSELYIDLEHTEIAKIWVLENQYDDNLVELLKGSIEKLIGRKLTWEDEPVELKEQS